MHGCLLSDNIRAMRSVFARLALATAALAACNTPSPEGAKKDAPQVTKDVATKDAPVDAKSTPPPSTPDAKAPLTPPDGAKVADSATPPPDANTPEAAGATAGTPPDPAAAAADKAKLLDEAKAKKTSDTRAKKALEEAEKAGATARELAEVANARGEALFDEPERAEAFFTWARDKDTTYPEPVFNLAKQTVNAGEIPATVEHLKEVHKRGGKKLLKQIGFDPSFEIVKDDPEVQKLLK